ncbi:hypothetical protein E2320_013105, partial [Naja naja]
MKKTPQKNCKGFSTIFGQASPFKN